MRAAIMVPGPEGGVWDIRDVQRPVVPPGHILARVYASSLNRAEMRDVMPALQDGRLRPIVDRTFALSDIAAAQNYLEADRHVGKVVIRV